MHLNCCSSWEVLSSLSSFPSLPLHFPIAVFPDSILKEPSGGLPDGSVVKRSPAKAGDTGWIPEPGTSHMPQGNQAHTPQLLSPRSTTTETALHNY